VRVDYLGNTVRHERVLKTPWTTIWEKKRKAANGKRKDQRVLNRIVSSVTGKRREERDSNNTDE